MFSAHVSRIAKGFGMSIKFRFALWSVNMGYCVYDMIYKGLKTLACVKCIFKITHFVWTLKEFSKLGAMQQTRKMD